MNTIMHYTYKQEMNLYIDLLKKIQSKKQPKVICFHYDKNRKNVELTKLPFKPLSSPNKQGTLSALTKTNSLEEVLIPTATNPITKRNKNCL
jgi:hypothetical protein